MTKRIRNPQRRLAILVALGLGLWLLYRLAPWIHPALDYRSGFLPRARAVEWAWAGALQPSSIRVTVEDDGGPTVTVSWSGRDHRDRELLAHRFVVEGAARGPSAAG